MRFTTVFYFILLLSFFVGCRKHEEPQGEVKPIRVAGLFSETGELSYLGLTSEAVLQMGVDYINQDFVNRDVPFRFELSVFDTELSPAIAKEKLISLAGEGCKLVIGPQTSAELAMLKPVADSAGVLVVSPSSTASTLAIANDMVFRYSPGDQIVGRAMARSYLSDGKQVLISISRNDAGSMQLNSSASSHFVELGGQVFNAGVFSATDTDFTVVLDSVNQLITELSAIYSPDQIGVLTTSFDETTLLMEQADAYTALAGVKWYGGIGFFKNQQVLSSPAAAHFATAVHFTSLGFSLPESRSDYWQPLLTQIQARTGLNGDALTLCAFDVLRVMVNMVEATGGLPATAEGLRNAFQTYSQGYNGATGRIELNEFGDRANGTFDFWAIETDGNNYQWGFVGQSD